MMAELRLRNDRGLTDRPGLLDGMDLDRVNLDGPGLCTAGRSSAAQAKAALACSRIYDLRRLIVVQDGETVVLRGRVSSFYHMQLAQEVVRNATDGAEVVNAIRVVYQPERREAELDRAG